MIGITRRTALGLMAAVATPSAAAVAIAAARTSTPHMTPEARYAFHLAELKKAAEEIDPQIGSWHIVRDDGGDLGCGLFIAAYRVTGRYEGDGIYEGGPRPALGHRVKYRVTLLDYRTDGHRMFEVKTPMDRMVLAEPKLNTFIGRKIGGEV